MPQWRKLHTKSVESLDIHDMPDDFHRLLWLMLPLVLDRCGRGVDSAAWVRSKAMPMRDDVTNEMAAEALDWYVEHEMIERYEVNGRHYFWIPAHLMLMVLQHPLIVLELEMLKPVFNIVPFHPLVTYLSIFPLNHFPSSFQANLVTLRIKGRNSLIPHRLTEVRCNQGSF